MFVTPQPPKLRNGRKSRGVTKLDFSSTSKKPAPISTTSTEKADNVDVPESPAASPTILRRPRKNGPPKQPGRRNYDRVMEDSYGIPNQEKLHSNPFHSDLIGKIMRVEKFRSPQLFNMCSTHLPPRPPAPPQPPQLGSSAPSSSSQPLPASPFRHFTRSWTVESPDPKREVQTPEFLDNVGSRWSTPDYRAPFSPDHRAEGEGLMQWSLFSPSAFLRAGIQRSPRPSPHVGSPQTQLPGSLVGSSSIRGDRSQMLGLDQPFPFTPQRDVLQSDVRTPDRYLSPVPYRCELVLSPQDM